MLDRGGARCRDVRQGKNEVSRSYTEEEGGVGMLDRGRTRYRDVRQGTSDEGTSEVSRC